MGLQWRISRGRKVWMKGERLEWWPNGGCLCVWACQMWWSQSKGDGGSGRGEEFKFLLKLNRNNDYWTVRRKPEKERGVQQSECTPQDAKCWDVFLLKWWVCVAQTAISVAASKIGWRSVGACFMQWWLSSQKVLLSLSIWALGRALGRSWRERGRFVRPPSPRTSCRQSARPA